MEIENKCDGGLGDSSCGCDCTILGMMVSGNMHWVWSLVSIDGSNVLYIWAIELSYA